MRERKQRSDAALGFQDILPHIATLYRRSLLVPFIGSGMSLPACTSWAEFLRKLALEASVEEVSKKLSAKKKRIEPSVLSRLADETVSALRPLPYEQRSAKYRRALVACNPDETASPPPQSEALAQCYWPLVLTTNYDDLYWSAASKNWGPPLVLGRRLEDCYQVLRSLDEPTPPVLWALQGFLGGQSEKRSDVIVGDAKRRRGLIDQLVVGHQQYQRVINAEEHFRRAFAEVFRRRSLLFLGSGLLEDYLVNLFGEIIHYHGPGPHPHFALLWKKDAKRFDPWFLQNRLGIVPVFYKDHSELPAYLEELARFTSYAPERDRYDRAINPDEMAFTVDAQRSDREAGQLKIRLSKSGLPRHVAERECLVVSAGRQGDKNSPAPGGEAEKHLREVMEAEKLGPYSRKNWVALDAAPSYAFRYKHPDKETGFFAVAARSRDPVLASEGKKYDPRDLGIIPEAVCTTLELIDKAGFKVVHIGPVASSRYHRAWHPIHPFVQVIRGVRRFISRARAGGINSINLHVEDPSVWYPVLAGKIPVAELLSSDLATHKVELMDMDGNAEVFTVTLRQSPTLDELLKRCKVNKDDWTIEIFPPPMGEKHPAPPEGEMVITPTMTVALKPINAAAGTAKER
ncbi:MAG TPA: SIR2 family protein [Blastocatellia bacterium]|nr:SIR2 family protein [Blastocatellia bacterium]